MSTVLRFRGIQSQAIAENRTEALKSLYWSTNTDGCCDGYLRMVEETKELLQHDGYPKVEQASHTFGFASLWVGRVKMMHNRNKYSVLDCHNY